MSADLLRQAAKLMREDAAAALHEAPRRDDVPRLPEREAWQVFFANRVGSQVGKYAAFMHPTVALAVADWLDSLALSVENRSAFTPGLNHGEAVARAYLGEEAS